MTALKKQMEAYERMRNDLELEHFGEWVVLYDEELRIVRTDGGRRCAALWARAVFNQADRRGPASDFAGFRTV